MTENPKVEAAQLFSEIMRTLKRRMRQKYANSDMTMPQGLVMGALMKSGGMKISELSQKLNLSNSTISGIINRLEKRQFVFRTKSQEDRRIVYVKVSPKFEEFHKGMYKEAMDSFAEMLNTATPEEIGTILDGLQTLRKVLNDNPNNLHPPNSTSNERTK